MTTIVERFLNRIRRAAVENLPAVAIFARRWMRSSHALASVATDKGLFQPRSVRRLTGNEGGIRSITRRYDYCPWDNCVMMVLRTSAG